MKRFRHVVLAISGLALLAGCGGGVKRTVNVSNGEYYTPEEFAKLSKEQRAAYCADLDQELAGIQSQAQSTRQQASSAQGDVTSLQREIRDLEGRYRSAQGEVDAVQDQIDYFQGLPKMHTVQDGEFLHKISGYDQIYADPLKWPRIYRANKSRIEDPNLIFPGWELTIPRDWPRSWTVSEGEYLSKISWYWEVYDDPKEWTKLYEANKDQVKDPDIIWPGWELRIPRN